MTANKAKQALVPKLRFKDYGGEWKKTKIGQILKIGSGKDYKHLDTGIIPVFGTGGLMTKVNKPLFSGETVFIGRKGSIDKPFYFNGDFWTVDTLFYTYNFNSSIPKFVYCLFQKINWYVHNEASGVPSLSKKTIESIQINIPSIPEQQKIASFLSVVDEKIELLTRKKELLENYKKGAMQQLFSHKLRFKDADGKDFPVWEQKRLGDVGELKNGINKDKKDFGFGSPFVNLMDVFGKCELYNQHFELVNANEKEKQLYNLKKGDVLFIRSSVKRTGVGETVIIQEDLFNTVYSGFLIRFRDKENILYQDFKKYCFLSRQFRNELLSYATSSANTNINQESLNIINLNIPSIPEQQKIASFLSAIDDKIEAVNQQITQSQRFKKGLLQQMFV